MTAPGRVMTPRPASQRLARAAARIVGDRPALVADVGTGSGAIAVSLAVALPRAHVIATDTSADAVALARENARLLGLSDRVSIATGDLLEGVTAPLDLIVANLPYLPLGDVSADPDLAAEPADAVFAPGDGLELYRRLIAESRRWLRADGALVIQFRRRVITAARGELDLLADAFGASRAALRGHAEGRPGAGNAHPSGDTVSSARVDAR